MKEMYVLNSDANKEFLNSLKWELLEFGKNYASPEGGSYYLGDAGEPWKDRNRETWITCRMTHVYGMGAMMGMEGALELCNKGIKGLLGELKDKKNGGWYAGVTPSGDNLELKQCYAHAFVILAGTTGLLAGAENAKELLEEALETFDKFFWDDEIGLAVDTWNTEFTELDSYRGLNANMHSVEAFLAVYDATGDRKYLDRAGRIIEHVIGWGKDNSYRIPEHFTSDWIPNLEENADKPDDPFKPYGATPGHGIEWSRLISQWAIATYGIDNGEKDCYIEIAKKLFDRAVGDAWNCDGAKGIVYTTDWNGKAVVRDRMHWTLAEAINTSATLYNITGDARYAECYADFMEYLDEDVHDKVNGSWFHQLDENNKLKGSVWPGKSDLYHAFQAMIIPYAELGVSVAKCVYNDR